MKTRFLIAALALLAGVPALTIGVATSGMAADKPVAVFAHGAIGRVLRGLFLRASQSDILAMDQPQDAFYRLHDGAARRIAG